MMYRLIQAPTPSRQQHRTEHQKVYKELKVDPALGIDTDAIVPKHNSGGNFQIEMPDRVD